MRISGSPSLPSPAITHARSSGRPDAPAPVESAPTPAEAGKAHGLVRAAEHSHRSDVAALRQWINHPDLRNDLALPDLSVEHKGNGFKKALAAYEAAIADGTPPPATEPPPVTDPVPTEPPPVTEPVPIEPPPVSDPAPMIDPALLLPDTSIDEA